MNRHYIESDQDYKLVVYLQSERNKDCKSVSSPLICLLGHSVSSKMTNHKDMLCDANVANVADQGAYESPGSILFPYDKGNDYFRIYSHRAVIPSATKGTTSKISARRSRDKHTRLVLLDLTTFFGRHFKDQLEQGQDGVSDRSTWYEAALLAKVGGCTVKSVAKDQVIDMMCDSQP